MNPGCGCEPTEVLPAMVSIDPGACRDLKVEGAMSSKLRGAGEAAAHPCEDLVDKDKKTRGH